MNNPRQASPCLDAVTAISSSCLWLDSLPSNLGSCQLLDLPSTVNHAIRDESLSNSSRNQFWFHGSRCACGNVLLRRTGLEPILLATRIGQRGGRSAVKTMARPLKPTRMGSHSQVFRSPCCVVFHLETQVHQVPRLLHPGDGGVANDEEILNRNQHILFSKVSFSHILAF